MLEFHEKQCSDKHTLFRECKYTFELFSHIWSNLDKFQNRRCSQIFEWLWFSWKSVQWHNTSLMGINKFGSLLSTVTVDPIYND